MASRSRIPAGAGRAAGEAVRLTDDDGVIAIAEPRTGPNGVPLLKPVVGLRG